MAKNAIARLTEAIGYPERVSDGVASFTLQIDGGEIDASEAAGRIRLVFGLAEDAAQLPRLAEYAAGRMLREDATLAFGQLSTSQPSTFQPSAFLWQEVPADADAHALRRFFEACCDSCDWWRERLERGRDESQSNQFPEMMIRP